MGYNDNIGKAQLYIGPYTYVKAVDLSAVDFIPLKTVCEIRCKTAGAIKVDTPQSTGETIILGENDSLFIRITKVYKVGTDVGLATSNIVVYGFDATDLAFN